jgi:HK97 gp10 family phage protein
MDLKNITFDTAAIKALESNPEVLAAVGEFTDAHIVPEMRRRAPKDTGAGAESIHSEPDPDVPGFRVSWDRDHFYMLFHELGTQHQPARPFARPTADMFNRR